MKYYTTEETAELVGVSASTLKQNRLKKIGIPYRKIGRLVRYSLEDIQNYMDANRVETGVRA